MTNPKNPAIAANFASDNFSGCAPEIMAALAAANTGLARPYGQDDYTQALDAQYSNWFDRDVRVFPVVTGSAANALALAALSPPFGSIYCHANAHINTAECAAPEFYTGGAKLIPLPGGAGKLHAPDLEIALKNARIGAVNVAQPAAISLTQGTEAGTIYWPEELNAIAAVARQYDLRLHMDGARFANALVSLGCTPAEITWRAGIDVLCLGATKNGAIAAEAIIFFDLSLAENFAYRCKRGGHLWSKMRFLSVQLQAYLQDDLWLRNATHANQMATQLAAGLAELPTIEILYPVEMNELFVCVPAAIASSLRSQGFGFYQLGTRAENVILRLVTSFTTQAKEVAAFIAAARQSNP